MAPVVAPEHMLSTLGHLPGVTVLHLQMQVGQVGSGTDRMGSISSQWCELECHPGPTDVVHRLT